MIQRGRGLVDLIAGVTPTLVDWTNNPTNAENITDGDSTTVCNTGNKVQGGGYQFAYFEWQLGAEYDILTGGQGYLTLDAGSLHVFIFFYNNGAWHRVGEEVTTYGASAPFVAFAGRASAVRLAITSSMAATIVPSITEFNVWRLK